MEGIEIDKDIEDLVKALNAQKIYTTSSCSGHGEEFGHIFLGDGRLLVIVPKERTKHEITHILNWDVRETK